MFDAQLHTPPVRIVAVSGGLGLPSSTRLLADRLLAQVDRQLRDAGDRVEITVVELRELAVPIANHLVTGFSEPKLSEALAAIRAADGVIAVTPVFNGSMSGLFKSFFDLLTAEDLVGVPIVLGATGGSARHSLVIDFALRPLFAYLRAQPLSTGIFVATADWGADQQSDARDGVEARAARVATEFAAALRRTPATADAQIERLPTGQKAPTIAATREDFTAEARREAELRAEHQGFAELMTQYAGLRDGLDAP